MSIYNKKRFVSFNLGRTDEELKILSYHESYHEL